MFVPLALYSASADASVKIGFGLNETVPEIKFNY